MFFSFYLKESRLCCRRGRVQVGDVNCCVSLCVSLSELHRITLMLGHNQSNLTVSVDYTVTKATCPVTVLYGSQNCASVFAKTFHTEIWIHYTYSTFIFVLGTIEETFLVAQKGNDLNYQMTYMLCSTLIYFYYLFL